jgi:hypothetical protein
MSLRFQGWVEADLECKARCSASEPGSSLCWRSGSSVAFDCWFSLLVKTPSSVAAENACSSASSVRELVRSLLVRKRRVCLASDKLDRVLELREDLTEFER